MFSVPLSRTTELVKWDNDENRLLISLVASWTYLHLWDYEMSFLQEARVLLTQSRAMKSLTVADTTDTTFRLAASRRDCWQVRKVASRSTLPPPYLYPLHLKVALHLSSQFSFIPSLFFVPTTTSTYPLCLAWITVRGGMNKRKISAFPWSNLSR
jgi:hypothetical protein